VEGSIDKMEEARTRWRDAAATPCPKNKRPSSLVSTAIGIGSGWGYGFSALMEGQQRAPAGEVQPPRHVPKQKAIPAGLRSFRNRFRMGVWALPR
jgi:hypothetical protein